MPMAPRARLEAIADGVWCATHPVRIVGMPLSTTMTVLRLGDAGLLVHSPVALDDGLRAEVEALGPIRHLYAPNTFHHLWLGDWLAAVPDARVHAPPGLARKRPDLRIDRVHGSGAAPEPDFEGVVDEVPIEGFRLEETAILHRPGRTLVLADLVQNVGRPAHPWARLYTRLSGFYDRVALSRVIRWTAFSDRRAARASVESLLSLPFDRVVVGHGEPLVADARARLAAGVGWLGVAER